MNIILMTYYLVASRDVDPWISNDRVGFNQTNGVIFASLLELLVANDLALMAMKFTGAHYPESFLLPIIVCLAVFGVNYWLIVSRGAGARYAHRVRDMPRQEFHKKKLITLTTAVMALLVFLILTPGRQQESRNEIESLA